MNEIEFDQRMDEIIDQMGEIGKLPVVTEKDVDFKMEQLGKLREKVEDLIAEAEVEDFLENGPGQKDPN